MVCKIVPMKFERIIFLVLTILYIENAYGWYGHNIITLIL